VERSLRKAAQGVAGDTASLNSPTMNTGKSGVRLNEPPKRLITEFAIENAQVVARRHEQEIKARVNPEMTASGKKRVENKEPQKSHASNKRATDKAQNSAGKPVGHKDGHEATSPLGGSMDKNTTKHHSDKIAQRQQIIGRKRTLRRARKSGAS